MAANDIYTMTPGSAVASQLQEILTRKHLEQRQAMQDSLEQQNVQSQIQARAMNSAEQKSRIDYLNSDRKAQEIKRMTEMMSPHSSNPATLAYLHQNAPQLIDPGQPAVTLPNPEDVGPERPEIPESFHGLPPQLETERKDKEQADAMAILQDPEKRKSLDNVQLAMLYRKATGSEPGSNIIKEDEPYEPVYVNGKPTGEWAPKGAIHINEPKPDRPYATSPITFTKTGDDGTETEVPGVFNPNAPAGTSPYQESTVPAGLRIHGKLSTPPKTPTVKPSYVKEGAWGLFTNALSAANRNKGDDNAQMQLTSQGNHIIDQSPVDTDVKELLKTKWADLSKRGKIPALPVNASPKAKQFISVWRDLNPQAVINAPQQ